MTDDASTAQSIATLPGERLLLTILAHPDLRRIGDRFEAKGTHLVLSRNTPRFVGSGKALEVRSVSRTPVQLDWRDRSVHIDGTVWLNGADVAPTTTLGHEEARNGAFVALGRHVLLHIRLVDADIAPLEPLGPASPELRQCVVAARALRRRGRTVALCGAESQGRLEVLDALGATAGDLQLFDEAPESPDDGALEYVTLPSRVPVEDLASVFGAALRERLEALGREARVRDCVGWWQAEDAYVFFRYSFERGSLDVRRYAHDLAMQVGERVDLSLLASGGGSERQQLIALLRRYDYRISVCAKAEGVSPNTLRRKMQFFGVHSASDVPDVRIEQAWDTTGGDVAEMARLLQVSEHGLRLRLGRSPVSRD